MPDLPDLTTEQIRRVIELHAAAIEDVADAIGKSRGSAQAYVRGAVPIGAPPVPTAVKILGNVRVFCLPEWIEWAKRAE